MLTIGLATVLSANLVVGETLRLKIEPDRTVLVKGSPQEVVVKIDLAAIAQKKKTKRTPLNLAVVLDHSGSMAGAKLEKARQAAMELVDQLAADDVFSFVIYNSRAEVIVPAQRVEDKEALKARIAKISANGGTALHAGVTTGAEQLAEHLSSKRINRVILLSDGLANVGPKSTGELRTLGNELAGRNITVTTIGVGEDYNEDLMAGLAEASDANYYYVKDTETLPAIFAKELGELLAVAAREVRIEIICPKGVKPIGFIGRAEQFENQKAVVTLSSFTPGQSRHLFLRCLVNEPEPEIVRVTVSYTDELAGGANRSASDVVKIRFTENKAVAAKSVNSAVASQKELVVTAVVKDAAMAAADAGNYKEASVTLTRQVSALNAAYGAAPADVQVQIRSELDNLNSFNVRLERGEYNFRKEMQSQSYNTRNSK